MSLIAGGNANILLENLFVHRIGQWRNQLPFSGTNSVTGQGIGLENCDGVLIKNCELTKMRIPISIKATKVIRNIEVVGCDLHTNIVWGIDVAPRAAGAVLENITIKNTKIRDYHQFDAGNWLGGGEKPHTDGIFLRSAGMESTWNNINILGCEFYSDNSENSRGGTASIYVSQGPSVNIFNNVFIRDRHSRCIDVTSGGSTKIPTQTVNIVNNTFVDSPPVTFSNKNSVPNRYYRYSNNIVLITTGSPANKTILTQADTPLIECDNNVYFSADFAESKAKGWHFSPGGAWLTLPDVKQLGWESSGRYGDPVLNLLAGLPSKLDLRPRADSAAANAGKNFSNLFKADKDGKPRPAVGKWDAGAYLAMPSGAAPALSAPRGFRVSGQTTN